MESNVACLLRRVLLGGFQTLGFLNPYILNSFDFALPILRFAKVIEVLNPHDRRRPQRKLPRRAPSCPRPCVIPTLTKAGFEVVVEAGAGTGAGYPDAHYTEKGANIVLTAPPSSPPPTSSPRSSATARTTSTEKTTCRCFA